MTGVASAFARAAAATLGVAPAAARHEAPAAPASVAPARGGWAVGAAVWTLLLLMIVPDGFDYAALDVGGAPAAGSKLSRLLWLALLGFGAAATLWHAAASWRVARHVNACFVAFVVLAVASVAWSIEPAVTARRLVRLATIALVALAFASVAWHPRRLQAVLRPALTVVLLASLAFGLGWPALAIHGPNDGALEGAWRGLASHKNGFGSLACIGALLWWHGWLAREVRLLPALGGIALAVTCLALSRSSTAIVVAAFTALFMLGLLRSPPALRRYIPWLVALFLGALVAYSLVLLGILPGLHTLLGPIGALTGKDLTFTGRTDIWQIMFDHIGRQPWLGSGFGAYWNGTVQGAPSFDFMIKLGFDPGSAHNGYLDVLNDLGAIGLIALFGYLALYVAHALRLLPADRAQAALLLGLFLQQAVTNLAESRWFSVLSVDFVLMTLATAALARALADRRAAGAGP